MSVTLQFRIGFPLTPDRVIIDSFVTIRLFEKNKNEQTQCADLHSCPELYTRL
jgi:hypothetical protein